MKLPAMVIALLMTFAQPRVTSSMDHSKMLGQFEPPTSASSKDRLIDIFKALKSYFTVEEVHYRGTDYLFFTVDKGSGMYLIHGYLYKTTAGHPVEVLRLYPQANASKLAVFLKGNRLTVKAVMPDRSSKSVADYILSEGG